MDFHTKCALGVIAFAVVWLSALAGAVTLGLIR
jgi:hypothetical protein